MKFFKKGQAAMEFIMTYGWAIIIVAAALGIISYLGFFRGGNVADVTTFDRPFVNLDVAVVKTNSLELSLRNDAVDVLNITGAELTSERGSPGCTANVRDVGSATPQAIGSGYEVGQSDRFVLIFNGCTLGEEGNRIDYQVNIDYYNEYTGLSQTQVGTVKGTIKP